MLLIYIWFLHRAQLVFSQKAIERFELAESDALSLKFWWQINSAVSISALSITCSRSDDKETISSSLSVADRTVTITDLAPNTKYKCKLEVSVSSSTETSDFVDAETLIGEACMQPVGFETGIIIDNNIRESSQTSSKNEYIKLHNGNGFWCSDDGEPYIQIDLGRIMTITGFAIQGKNAAVEEIYIKYKIKLNNDPSDGTQYVSTENDAGRVQRRFVHPKNQLKRYWFLESGLTVRYMEFLSVDKKRPFCLQVELYGCSEICSSKLNPLWIYHVFQSNSSSSNWFDGKHMSSEFNTSKCIEVNQNVRFDFGKKVTVSGFMLLIKNASVQVNVSVQYGNRDELPTLEHRISKTFSTSSVPQSYVTFWFDDMLSTRYIELSPLSKDTCMSVIFTGCNSANMKKLGIEARKPEITVTASSSYANGPGNNADKGRLNAMIGDWTRYDNDLNPWFQICFKELQTVSAIALQGQGYYNKGHITKYSVKYGYSVDVPFLYSVNGSNYRFSGTNCRYATTVNEFPVELVARCLRLEQFLYYHSVSARLELLGNEESLPPKATLLNQVFNVKNSIATITCTVFGQPGVSIQWRKEFSGRKFITDDNMNYIITVNNKSIDVNGTYYSYLEIKPEVHLNVDNSSTDCQVYDNKTASCFFGYSVTASYPESKDVFSYVKTTVVFTGYDAVVDDPVANVVATNISVNITWSTEESVRDFKTEFYNFHLIEHSRQSNTTVANSNTSNKYVWFDSKPYTSYTFLLTAFNRLGIRSNAVHETFITAEGYPSEVLNFSVLSVSKESIMLIWYHPENPNGKITSYSVEYGELNSSRIIFLNISASHWHLDNQTYEVANLRNFQEYQFRVRAVTNHHLNPGAWSNWIEKKTLEGIPSAPENLTGNATSSRDILLQWKEPKHPNGILRNYTISFNGSKYYNSSFKHYGELFVSSTETILEELFPGTKYEIFVNAETIDKGPSSELIVTLPYAEPHAPVLKLKNQSSELRKIVLYTVPSFTGPISYYEVSIQDNIENCTSHTNAAFIINSGSNINELIIHKGDEAITLDKEQFQLGLIGKFLVCYRAVINDTLSGNVYKGTFSHLFLERSDLAKVRKEEITVGVSTITLSLSRGPLSTRYYQVIVFKGDPKDIDPSPSELKPYVENSNIYIAAEFEASYFDYLQNFTIGDGKMYNRLITVNTSIYNYASDVVENVKLQDGTSYAILQRAYENEAKYYSTPWFVNVQTEKKSTSLPPLTLTAQKKAGIEGVIGGVSGGVVCIIILLAVLGVKIIRRQKRGLPYKKEKPINIDKSLKVDPTPLVYHAYVQDQNECEDEIPVSKEKEVTFDKKPPDTIVVDSHHPPISLAEFPALWDLLIKDSYHALSEEYKSLNSGQLYNWNDGVSPEVKSKNRYANIVPYDHSRVHLGNDLNVKSNYINASFIHGYSSQNTYIATQGPNASSVDDFWKMIWEQDVPAIVMLTNLIEKGKIKCELYWPLSGAKTFDNIEVTISSTDTFSDYIIRKFSIKKVDGKEKKVVFHFQYLQWPDQTAPDFVSDILIFRHRIRKVFPYELTQKPVVVHCSAGVGRTGTFICVDAMLDLQKHKGKVDIFNYVNFMRSRRIYMIQTEDQYLFVYRAIFESITCGVTETLASDFKQQKIRLQAKHGSTDGFQDQLEKLKLFSLKPNPEEISNALKEVNKSKNRNQEILPSDEKRVILINGLYENDGGDYINAVFVNGFKKVDQFIATQHPLPDTLSDFWTMVLLKKIGTIVMLHDTKEESELPKLHGTLNHKETYKNASVVMKHQSIEGNVTFKNVLVNSNFGKDSVECGILCFEWPVDKVPDNPNDLISLITKMEKQQSKHEGSPIIVMCRDGASRCGTFLACSVILHHLQLEQAVDVFQTVRKIRTSRPQFVNNVLHFKFCYDLASTYIDSFNSYSNFTDLIG